MIKFIKETILFIYAKKLLLFISLIRNFIFLTKNIKQNLLN